MGEEGTAKERGAGGSLATPSSWNRALICGAGVSLSLWNSPSHRESAMLKTHFILKATRSSANIVGGGGESGNGRDGRWKGRIKSREEKRGREEDTRAHWGVKGSRGREGGGRGERRDLNQS